MKDKKFNYSMDEIQGIYSDINTMFALEGLSEEEEEDLDDYDPEDDYDGDIDEDEDLDAEIDGDSDPAEEEDDEYDDVVENVGISNMGEFLTIDEEDMEAFIQASNAVEAAFGIDIEPDSPPPTRIDPDDRNTSVRIKDFVSVLDPRPDFEDKSVSDILDVFEETYLDDDEV